MGALSILSAVFVILGLVFMAGAAYGVVRFPDFFTRLHAAGVGDTLGALLILIGMMLSAGAGLITFKLLAIFIMLLLTNPLGTNLIMKAAVHERNYQGYNDRARRLMKAGLAEALEEGTDMGSEEAGKEDL